MSERTIIAWTDHTANFWLGCQKVSPGCAHCYAETLAVNRMKLDVWGPASTTRRRPAKGIYDNLRKWNRASDPANPSRVFVGSMMDWAEDHPDAEAVRPAMWDAIRQNDRLVYQMLTKRADRIAACLPADWGEGYPNVWLGVSVEDQQRADERIPHLLRVPAAVRFLSVEPLLGPVDLSGWLALWVDGEYGPDDRGVDWVIVGGESGEGFRPMDHAWARALRDQCRERGVAFFFKQSAGRRTETGIRLDGEVVREYPETGRTPLLLV